MFPVLEKHSKGHGAERFAVGPTALWGSHPVPAAGIPYPALSSMSSRSVLSWTRKTLGTRRDWPNHPILSSKDILMGEREHSAAKGPCAFRTSWRFWDVALYCCPEPTSQCMECPWTMAERSLAFVYRTLIALKHTFVVWDFNEARLHLTSNQETSPGYDVLP